MELCGRFRATRKACLVCCCVRCAQAGRGSRLVSRWRGVTSARSRAQHAGAGRTDGLPVSLLERPQLTGLMMLYLDDRSYLKLQTSGDHRTILARRSAGSSNACAASLHRGHDGEAGMERDELKAAWRAVDSRIEASHC